VAVEYVDGRLDMAEIRFLAVQTLGKQTCKIPGWTLKRARTRDLSRLFAL
jgi:hypothetical protein